MKTPLLLIAGTALWSMLSAQTPDPAKATSAAAAPAAPGKLLSAVYDWKNLKPAPRPNGERSEVFDGPTATTDLLHCHVTTLKPGANSGEPRRHLQEEVIVVKEGLVEAHFDGKTQTVGPGSVIYFAANAVTRLRNAGDTPATYIVIYFYTPLTPKE